jgi:hypothetical protein
MLTPIFCHYFLWHDLDSNVKLKFLTPSIIVVATWVGLLNMIPPTFRNCLRSKFLKCLGAVLFSDKYCHFFKAKFGETLGNFGISSVNLINFVKSSMVKIDFSYRG